jgi:hypothetical protein
MEGCLLSRIFVKMNWKKLVPTAEYSELTMNRKMLVMMISRCERTSTPVYFQHRIFQAPSMASKKVAVASRIIYADFLPFVLKQSRPKPSSHLSGYSAIICSFKRFRYLNHSSLPGSVFLIPNPLNHPTLAPRPGRPCRIILQQHDKQQDLSQIKPAHPQSMP